MIKPFVIKTARPHRLMVVSLLALSVGLSGCAGGLFNFNKDKEKAVASQGERISIIQFDQKLETSEALKDLEFFLPEAQTVSSWLLPGGNAEQSIEHVKAAEAFRIAWKTKIGEGSGRKTQVTAPPVAADGRIFTLDGEARVRATDALSGKQLWVVDLNPKAKHDKNALGGGLAVANGKLFVGSGFRFVAALDVASGTVLWRKPTNAPVHAAPTADDQRVFATDVDNQIVAYDQNTGEMAWNYQAIIEPARILKASTPAISGDLIIAPFSSGELVGIRRANGTPVWSDALSRTSRTNALSEIRDIAGRPVAFRGDVYAASHSGVFSAVDLRTGNRRWELPVESVNTPWVAGDVVYITSIQGELVAVNRDNGQVYWIRNLNEGYGKTKGGIAFGIGAKRKVYPVWTGPILASNRLIMLNSDGEAVTLDPKKGTIQTKLNLGSAAYIAPIAVGDMIYIVTNDGHLVAIR